VTASEPPDGKALGFLTPEKPQHRDMEVVRARLEGWMSDHLPGVTDVKLGPLSVPGANGIANETVIFDATWREGNSDRDGGFVARLETHDQLFPAGGVAVQAQMYRALADVAEVPVPAVFGVEPDPGLLDAPFYVMEKIEGRVPPDRPHYSFAGWVLDAEPEQRQTLWRSAVEAMTHVHSVPIDAVDFLERADLGSSGLEQCLNYWRGYYDGETMGRELRVMEEGWAWLVATQPSPAPTSLAWGDARISNMIFRDYRCVAVLDWDMVSLAGPGTDLGWWILQDQGTSANLPGMGTPHETVQLWEELSGRAATDLYWCIVFNAFRLGAIRMRLSRQMAESGTGPNDPDAAANNVAIQQVGLLLDLEPAGPVTAGLPDVSFLDRPS
jgi:aminoglycoside phosphotransferase (APT) family kinase protein